MGLNFNVFVFLLEISDKIPTVEELCLSGLICALLVLISTFVSRWLGLAILILTLLLSAVSISDGLGADILDNVISEMGIQYLQHWNYSIVFSVIIEISGFVLGVILKDFYRKKKVMSELK